MPIYEYKCHHCGHNLEKLQKISDAPLTDCPECKKPELRKKVSAAGFQLKGTGWYETDFKNKGSNKASTASSSSADKSGSGSSGGAGDK